MPSLTLPSAPPALLNALRARLPTPPQWRTTLLILLLLTNLKCLPLAWHVRLFYRFFSRLYSATDVRRSLSSLSPSAPEAQNPGGPAGNARRTHPIFEPVSISTHAPLLEIDYNLHKSNATYFSDLDESRTALMAKILGPALVASRARTESDRGFEARGAKGRVAVMLGSVHCSFHREVGVYERYEVRSRVLGWDRKWLVVGSWLVKTQRGKEVLLASALSKYVVKKGRVTVGPEHCLRVAGWLPEKEVEGDAQALGLGQGQGVEGSAVLVPRESELETEATPAKEAVEEDTPAASSEAETKEADLEAKITAAAEGPLEEEGPWNWARIERERLRGLRIAEGWLALDVALKEEFAREG